MSEWKIMSLNSKSCPTSIINHSIMHSKINLCAKPFVEEFKKVFAHNIKIHTDKKSKDNIATIHTNKEHVAQVEKWYTNNLNIISYIIGYELTFIPLVWPLSGADILIFNKLFVSIFCLGYASFVQLCKDYKIKIPKKWINISGDETIVIFD